jgi:hypothetical protein
MIIKRNAKQANKRKEHIQELSKMLGFIIPSSLPRTNLIRSKVKPLQLELDDRIKTILERESNIKRLRKSKEKSFKELKKRGTLITGRLFSEYDDMFSTLYRRGLRKFIIDRFNRTKKPVNVLELGIGKGQAMHHMKHELGDLVNIDGITVDTGSIEPNNVNDFRYVYDNDAESFLPNPETQYDLIFDIAGPIFYASDIYSTGGHGRLLIQKYVERLSIGGIFVHAYIFNDDLMPLRVLFNYLERHGFKVTIRNIKEDESKYTKVLIIRRIK